MRPVCRIEMLGGLRVAVAGRTIERFQTQKTGSLLAYLASNPGRAYARDAVAELLWPSGDPTAIRNRLNQAVSSLRRQLHPPELVAAPILVANHQTISLASDAISTDVEEFKRASRPNGPKESPSDLVARLERATELYQGEFLSGYYDDWTLSVRLFLHEQYIDALDRLIRTYVEVGQPERAVDLASRRIDADPFDESGHIRLMRLYLKLGRPRPALRQFEALARVLSAEGDEPSDVAQQLASKARLLDADAVDDEGTKEWAAVDAGRSLSLTGPQAEEHDRWSTVPRFHTRFVGREAECDRLDEWLRGGTKLATILGMGGCGKTRLACEFVRRTEHEFSVVWVPLAGAEDAKAVLDEVLKSTGVERAANVDAGTQIRAVVREMSSPLFVLDNLEQVVDAPYFDLSPILDSHPEVRVLCTSRRRIGIDGEKTLTLKPLPLPSLEPSTTVEDLARNPSIELFVSRAQLARQDFQLTDRTAASIARLCHRLEGFPLALELAASWARSMSTSQMLDEVSSRLDWLATRRRDIPERHRSMRAVLESSFAQLDESQQFVVTRVATFQGGADMRAIQALEPDLSVAELLDEIVSRSLLFLEGSDDRIRFAMPELLRQFVLSKIPADRLKALRFEHAAYFLEFVATAETMTSGRGATVVDGERSNVISALRHFIESDDWAHALKLAELLGGYFEFRNELEEGLHWLRQVERHASDVDPVRVAILRRRIATLSWHLGDFDSCRHMIELAVPVLRSADRPSDLIDALQVQRLEAHRQQDFEAALRFDDEIKGLCEESGDVVPLAHLWRQRGNTLIELGRNQEALDAYRESLRIAREIGLDDAVAFSQLNMGYLAIRMEMYSAAQQWLDEAGRLLETIGRDSATFDLAVCRLLLATRQVDRKRGCELLVEVSRKPMEGWLHVWEGYSTIGQFLLSVGETKMAAQSLGFAMSVLDRIKGGASRVLLTEFQSAIDTCRVQLGELFDEEFTVGRTMSYDRIRDEIAHLDLLAFL